MRTILIHLNERLVMLTYARRMNHHHHPPLTKASATNPSTTHTVGSTSSSTDEHTSSIGGNTDKVLLLSASLSQEPTTPCILDTPNTCTKNASFFYESPFNIPTTTTTTSILPGKHNVVSVRPFKQQKDTSPVVPIFARVGRVERCDVDR